MKPVYKKSTPRVQQLSATKTLTAESALNRQPKTPHHTEHVLAPHSSRGEAQTRAYHERIRARHTGGRQSSARITDQLNPDHSVSMANKTGRSFPGLVN